MERQPPSSAPSSWWHRIWQSVQRNAASLSGVPFALLYRAVARLLFGQNLMGDAFATLSLAFLGVAPLGVGASAVWFTRSWARTSWGNAILAPWIAIGLGAVVAALFFVEAWICVVMALPILKLAADILR
jgi:hypothetical protein